MADLYRIPVDEPNYSQVLETPVDPGQYDHLPPLLRERGPIRLWAVKPGERNERLYDGLSKGDGLLFYRGAEHDDANEGRYVAVGRVAEKALLNEAAATEVFRTSKVRRAYIVEQFTSGPWPRETVEPLLGYSGYPQGPQRVRDDRYRTVADVLGELTDGNTERADGDGKRAESGPTSPLDRIVRNALNGRGVCDGCPAHRAGNCKRVNPGLGDYDADIAFVTEEPKHSVNWNAHEGWAAWSGQYLRKRFLNADGGPYIQSLLDPLGVSIQDVWIADSLKCPTINDENLGTTAVPKDEAFRHCRPYLDRELRDVDPSVVVTLGNLASERTLCILGRSEKIHTKSDAGRVFEMEPSVIVSPHWGAYNYMSNAEEARLTGAVRESLVRIYG
jgi:uracil-DNA glycosylase family 4